VITSSVYVFKLRFGIYRFVDMEIGGNDLARLEDDGDGLFAVDDNNDWNAAWDTSDDIVADEAEI